MAESLEERAAMRWGARDAVDVERRLVNGRGRFARIGCLRVERQRA